MSISLLGPRKRVQAVSNHTAAERRVVYVGLLVKEGMEDEGSGGDIYIGKCLVCRHWVEWKSREKHLKSCTWRNRFGEEG